MEDTSNWPYGSQAIPLSEPFSCEVRHIPLKRVFDILFSFFVLILAFPLFLLIAFAVRITSRGKTVYIQERIGRGGKPFNCYKFRTMHPDADARLKEILKNNPGMRNEWERSHKLKNDPRITFFGAFLRKSSLDELPQFWNVLRGDLSVVGPRPVVKIELETHMAGKADQILSIRPGLTGPWQISGRSDTGYEKRVELDLDYVRSQSLWGDVKIIVKTIPAMVYSKGAY